MAMSEPDKDRGLKTFFFQSAFTRGHSKNFRVVSARSLL